ncbi:MAG TPA: hypothetical protein VFQ44_02350 [Streptosporangiaceae bacterium]|nr:hypothetical protein [Streptosporangiaceae bacterium]
MTDTKYVLHHDGTWFYYLGRQYDFKFSRPHADGETMTQVWETGWFSTDHEAEVISMVSQALGDVTGYTLDDPDRESVRYPRTLTPDEYSSRFDYDDDDRMLYSAVRRAGTVIGRVVEGPWLRLDGEPPPDDGHSWVAELPYELQYRHEYRHLFPGYMPGFRDAMGQMIKSLPHVRYCFPAKRLEQQYGFEVTLEIPFDKPQSEYRPALNRDGSESRSRRGRMVPVKVTRRLEFTVPYVIKAANRAAAAAEWDRRETEIREAIAGASVAACSACMGHGYVITGSEDHEKKPGA